LLIFYAQLLLSYRCSTVSAQRSAAIEMY